MKFIKKTRIRLDRHLTRQILKQTQSDEKLPNIIKINNGSWEIL
ncbi:hypothetical protein [Campylobacter gastrosuis]|uniref:Uncharacterized protein n=1 Tax=Campylobacter gastrosuis TaxID=2974576 RepID=A0ABT7HPN1_9BACT|nr:hypothetical protein [Campylobacter gastrosuis]MDL0088682.1 hypothetical protein [Campylobacter gastrosuis]